MTPQQYMTAYIGLTEKEISRVLRVWIQTLLPPLFTALLYMIIFGKVIGHRVGTVSGVSYLAFLVPGLVIMNAILNAYNNVVFSFYNARFSQTLEEILVSPMSNTLIIASYVSGGVFRSLITATLVLIIGILFAHIPIAHLAFLYVTLILTAILFSLAGMVNAVFAKRFDDTTIVSTFILTPLIYLGGIFYNVHHLQGIWYTLSLINPIHYMVALTRYAMLGLHQTSIAISLGVLLGTIILLYGFCLYLMVYSKRLKS